MARPTKYNEQLVADVCQALDAGAPIRIASEFAGISEAVYYEYCKRYPEFREKTMRARMGQAIRNLALIQNAAPQDWRAAVEALRLSFPRDFGKFAMIEHTVDMDAAVKAMEETIASAIPDPEERRRLALRVLNGGTSGMGEETGS